ncbi:MAG: bifunctional diaminohydroxyphosphoribosylaminopyrimidine deaminase/5-amino-6-(5-phosphoribosylamino)uracil reductase RibD [Alphaproteobacteria bacterium]|nr:bifunctional diaminohydroxyphosphoribosylaminopyrimidine deaminase/5-amino-6-(5-phosphoribosylamino)uracil reductase RibD [Alphaproteobacteria bacterium]
MELALRLAARGLGRVSPNPAVGCVVVTGRRIVGRGWTQPTGRPHAETEALARARGQARGATAYVTLEPCAHHGRTPPCAEALVDAGIARAVVAAEDPDPRVAGGGANMLRQAGIQVEMGVRREAAVDLNAGFFSRIERGRPMVTLKAATTLDGRIAAQTGQSKWITGEPARRRAHHLRAVHDAILIGSETAVTDNPMLTCRLPGLEDRSPIRIVVDRRRRMEPSLALVESASRVPTWVFTAPGEETEWHARLAEVGAEVIPLAGAEDDSAVVDGVLSLLANRGITRLLVEGGAGIATAFVKAGVVDELALFRAPRMFGQGGRPIVSELALADIADAPTFERRAVEVVGNDILETYRARH